MPVRPPTRRNTRRVSRTPLTGASTRLPPNRADLIAEYRRTIIGGRLIAYRPPTTSATPQVKGSLFSVAAPEAVAYTGLLTTDVITASGTAPTCAVNGTLSMSANFWDMRIHRGGVPWAYLPGINVGGAFELDASGLGHHLYLTTTTIVEAVDGTGTNWANEAGYATFVAPPTGFIYPADLPPINVLVVDGAAEVVGFDIRDGMPTGKAYYVSTTGLDTNDGLTAETPLRKVVTAIGKADVVVIYVEAGLYQRANATNGAVIAKPLSIIGTGGRVILSAHDSLAWTADVTYPNVSKATRSLVTGVCDASILSANLDYTPLLLVASLAICAATPGSYYTDNVSVWVLPADARAADADIHAYLSVSNVYTTGYDIYLENCDLHGGNSPLRASKTTAGRINIRGKNSTFKFGNNPGPNGVEIVGNVSTVFEDCTAAVNFRDGFNYHWSSPYLPSALEINCTGRNNGYTNIDNGSTMHDAGTVIRIGGQYYNNFGPNVIDITGSYSWNVGVNSHDSINNDADWTIQGNMWLDSCLGDIFLITSGDLYYHNTPNAGIAGATPYGQEPFGRIPINSGSSIQYPGPLNVSATVTAGTTYPAVTIKAPLGPESQAIAEWTGEAAVDLSTFVNTDQSIFGSRYGLVYRVPLSAADKVRAERYVGV